MAQEKVAKKDLVITAKDLSKVNPDAEAYRDAISKMEEWEEWFKSWAVDNLVKIKFMQASPLEKNMLKKTFRYIVKNYDSKLDFWKYCQKMLIPSIYDK